MNNNVIIKPEGPDRIRKRPAVVFLSEGLEGAQNAVLELLYVFLREAQLGHCHQLRIRHSGETLEVSGDDRGIDLGQETGDHTKWESIFCAMFPLPKFPPEECYCSLELIDDSHYALYGEALPPNAVYFPGEKCFLELYALQCACSRMDVSVIRKGIHSTLHFEKGHNIGGIHNQATTAPNGTCFQFELDGEVFTQTVIPEAFFLDTLESFAMLSPGLCCTYENAAGEATVFCFPEGIADYAQCKATDVDIPVWHNRLEAKGKERYNRAEYKACVDIAIGYTPNGGSVRCFHNFRELTYGGTHRSAVLKQLCNAFNRCFCREHPPLTEEEIAKHFTVVIASWCPSVCTAWENGTRSSIHNQLIRDLAHDATVQEFENYLYRHKNTLQQSVDAALNKR